MFEGIVSDLLNSVLGKYIENLDSSKLKLSIWGGDVELLDLNVKQSALDELDLAVRPVFGHIRRLTLKIPWKKLYTSQWVAVVEGVFVIAVPNTSIEYNAEKEEKLLHESKMAALQRAEEARLKAKAKEKGDAGKTEDGFTEKLLAQVIRNIQVTIKDIHIRYEDSLSCPEKPFAMGFTLYDLSMKSTNAEWKPCLDTDKFIYKLNSMDSLAVYWNANATLFSETLDTKEKKIECLNSLIASQKNIPQGMNYIIGPISSTAKLTLNPKPEVGEVKFTHPKILLDLVMDQLSIGLSRHQYANVMALLDSLDRLKLSSKYRKFRPSVKSIGGHSAAWWNYAYNCITEDIRRVHCNWSWQHIKEHKDRSRSYKLAFKAKLEGKTLNAQQTNDLSIGEHHLDVFNIILNRRQAEMEVEREGQVRKQEQQQKGWFGGWFSWGGGKSAEGSANEDSIVKKFEAKMTEDEKKSLYDAIGYQESGVILEYPKEYVDVCLQFLLKELVFVITDEETTGAIVTKASLTHVTSRVQKRSGADAFRFDATMKTFRVEGFSLDNTKPQMVSSEGSPLLEVMFETQPEDGKCDQRLQVNAQPLEVIYNAVTINHLIQVFSPPQNISLQQLQAAALNQLEVVKERSVTSLQSVIDNQSILDLNVIIAASHIIIPESGSYHHGCSALVLTLGSMKMMSVPRRNAPALTELVSQGLSQEEVKDTIRKASYDCFIIELIDIQAMVAFPKEDWRPYLNCHNGSALHLLQPTTLHVDLMKCLLTNDPSLPKIKINVSLPSVALSVVDERLLHLACLLNSIPKAEPLQQAESGNSYEQLQDKDLNMNVIMEERDILRLERTSLSTTGEQQDTPQFTNLALKFTIHEISLEVERSSGNQYMPLGKLAALSASVELIQRTFDLSVTVILGGVVLQHLENGEKRLLSTPMIEGSSQALLTLKFIQVNPKSPDFKSKHDSTAQLLCIDVSHLKAQLEQSAILSLLAFYEQLFHKLQQVTPVTEADAHDKESSLVLIRSTEKRDSKISVPVKKNDVNGIVTLKVVAKLGQVAIGISLKNHEVAKVDIAGLVVNVVMKGDDITLTSKLKDFTVIDPCSSALHPKIVEVVGAEAWDAEISVYGKATEGTQYLDMKHVDTSITLTFGCARIVFLNKFVTDVLNWVDKFQMAKAAIASASVAAAQAAQAGLQDAYEQCSRIKLALTLRAPLILVPQDSHSLSGLMIDLGLITISNKFELGKERNELGHPSIYDKINLELHNVKLSRIELSKTGSLDQEFELLEPISLTITVCRNLAISWNKQCPELEVKAHLMPIKVSLSEEDLLVTLTVLQDNLGEQASPSLSNSAGFSSQNESVETSREVEMALAEHGHIFTKIKFTFTIEAVTLSLLTGGRGLVKVSSVSSINSNMSRPSFSSALDSLVIDAAPSVISEKFSTAHEAIPDVILPRVALGETGKVAQVAEYSEINADTSARRLSSALITGSIHTRQLAEFSLQVVTLKGQMMSDGSLGANLVLYDCVLQDTRLGREGYITRMMERKKKDGSNTGMIDITYKQGSANDKFADVRISGFVLVLHIPYLLSIQRFFTDNMPQQKEEKPSVAREIKRQKSTVISENEGLPTSLLTIRVKLEQPDIALVEDVTSLDTSCIILHAEVGSDIKITPTNQHVGASITNIQMYTCCYHPDRRQQTLSQILSRCEVTFMSTLTPMHAEHVDIRVSHVDLRVSPGTIELLSNLALGISSMEKEMTSVSSEDKNWMNLWDQKPLNPTDFPFLIVEEAIDAMMSEEKSPTSLAPEEIGPGGERADVEMECVLITLEAGAGTSPIPLIKLQASANLTATGFKSEKLLLSGNSSVELAYFNPRLAVWEPLLEPVEIANNFGTPEHVPWTVAYEMSQELTPASSSKVNTPAVSPVTSPAGSPENDEADFEELQLQHPITTLTVTAKDPLQLTVTKTFFEVLSSLSEAFSDAYKRKLTARQTPRAPYHIINHTGMHVSVVIKGSGFQIAGDGGENVEEVTVESGAEVDLFEVNPPTPKHKRVASLVADCLSSSDRSIRVTIPSLQSSCLIPVTRADKRYFQIENKRNGEKWGLVAAISVDSGCKIISLSSCVQVKNNLDVSVDVYYMTERGNEVEFVLTLEPDTEALLPLHAVYTPSAELFFSVKGHSVCIVPFVWRGLQNNPGYVQELQCIPRDVHEVHAVPFLISATGDVEQILWENTNRRTMSSALFKVQLWPCLVLHNLLPVPISLEPPGTITTSVLLPGCSIQLTKARLGSAYLQLQLMDYQYRDWVCGKAIETNPPELSVWTFESRGDQINGPLYLDLGMHISRTKSTLSLSMYCPFWMVNKTGLMLTYRKSRKIERSSSTSSTESTGSPLKGDALNNIVVHEEDNHEPVLFSFKSKSFFGKKKATIRVNDSDWSERFSLDVVGSSGSITCKGPGRTYQVGVDIKLGRSGLTKLVEFTPFYKILNKAKYDLEVMEVGVPQAEWFTVLSGECIGWWPLGVGRLIRVRVRGTEEITQPLPYHQPLAVLLKLSNKYGGVMAEVNCAEGGILMTLDECFDGATAVFVINQLTNTAVSLWQQDQESKKIELPPQTVQHYAWSVPAGLLQLAWMCGSGKPNFCALDKDDQGKMNNDTIHWVSFLNGNQRCLLFTNDIDIASSALNAVELERIHQEIKISLNFIGVSLVNDIRHKEITFISLSSSGVVWEHCKLKGKKHRPFTQDQTENLEKCYQLYQRQILAIGDASAVQSHFVISKNLEVDYVTMKVSKPFNRKIRRTFQPGVWFEYRTSPHQRHVHFKINSLQIDNQLSGMMFPVVFARVPPPRSVMAETVPKPFCEVSIVQRLTSPVFIQYKYFAVLVQEFHLKMELPFVYAVQEVISPSSINSVNLYSTKKYEQDITQVREPLQESIKNQAFSGQKDYFDQLHLSPIKMHLSFSLSGTESGSSIPVAGQVLHLFLQSVGVTLTEVQDLVFRLAYMERLHVWMNWNQFVQELMSHYGGQIIKQLYVLVLGLDVIGNPFGLVVGLGKGVEDLFYEPIQGAIEGPGEFAEGIVYGMTSFLGKTVGGAAGAFSRITGTLGKGIAALTLDEDYQRRRREAMNRKPADGLETIARGTKGVVTGVFDGVTGVVLRPIEGAKEHGVEGFFSGVGKGLAGLVTRPVSGVVDFASTSLDAVMRATDAGEEVTLKRPPRFIASDGIIRPFVSRFADGAKMLQEIEKGRYAETDVYVAHTYVTGSRSVLLATDKRIMLATRNDILGYIKVDWVHIYEELSEPPVLTPKGLRLSIKQEKKRVLGVFGGGDNSKVIHINDQDQAKWFQAELSKAYLKAAHQSA